MQTKDLIVRSIGRGRRNLLYRASAAIGRSKYEAERNGSAARYLGRWVMSAPVILRSTGDWRGRIRDAILDWVAAQSTFDEGYTRVAEALFDSEIEHLTTNELLAIRHLVGTVGFFTLTERLLERALDRAIEDFTKFPNQWSARNAFTARLLRRELCELADPLECWLDSGTSSDPTLVLDFVELCRAQSSSSSPSQHVTIVGPGPVGDLGREFRASAPICRVLMPGVVSWPKDDLFGGRADIGYLNGDTTRWLSLLSPSERESLVTSFSVLRIKRDTTWEADYPSVSQIRRIKELFLTGEPNMVPSAVVDQLVGGVSRVYVTGTSFFVGAEPYRTTERRYFYTVNAGSDAFGAVYKNSFERCYSHSTHDQIVNRSIVRLMFDAGRVVGDDLFTRALLMSDKEYLLELEEGYGRSRR